MPNITREALNRFLIEDFNHVLRAEEHALFAYKKGFLSVHEFHIIEVVIIAVREKKNTMGEIARKLGITMGTLTSAVKSLEKKGCLRRQRSEKDKRVVRLEVTEAGTAADVFHQEFHTHMVEAVAQCLSEEQLLTLTRALGILSGYFTRCASFEKAGSNGFSPAKADGFE